VTIVWDSDVLSEFSKGRNPVVVSRGSAYLATHRLITFSLISRYEVLRGLRARRAHARLARFEFLCQSSQVLPITDDIIVLAADHWAGLQQKGQLIGDNDLFIAATALHHGLAVATGNVAHFSRIAGLAVEDWTKP
jgi:tRNA(fMet)-specific endonuclease VapC